MPPSRLRSHNPWNLPLTGPWHFALTHGRIIAGEFQPSTVGANGISASSNEEKNLPENAFDGSLETRWCASDSSFPQSLEADLGKVRPVAGVILLWEKPDETYQSRIEGGRDGKHWQPLTDTPVRFVRVTVLGNSSGHWASLREVQIRLIEGGAKSFGSRPR